MNFVEEFADNVIGKVICPVCNLPLKIKVSYFKRYDINMPTIVQNKIELYCNKAEHSLHCTIYDDGFSANYTFKSRNECFNYQLLYNDKVSTSHITDCGQLDYIPFWIDKDINQNIITFLMLK